MPHLRQLTSMLKSHFGAVLRKLRLQRGLTQENLASLSHMERTFISMLERGVKQPSLESICNLSQAFGLRTHELLHLFEQEIMRAGLQDPNDPDLGADQRNLDEMASRQDHLKIDRIIETLPVAFFTRTSSPEFRPTFFSTNIKKLTGFERESFLGSNAFWLERIHPEDRAVVLQNLHNLSQGGRAGQLNYRFATRSGAWLQIREELRFTSGPNGASGEILGTLTGAML